MGTISISYSLICVTKISNKDETVRPQTVFAVSYYLIKVGTVFHYKINLSLK